MTKKRQLASSDPVSDQVVSAIQTILSYLWNDERADYQSRVEADRRGHIFHELRLLAEWAATLESTRSRCD